MHASWAAFWEMGGYGAFVWPCYGLAALTLAGIFYAVNRSESAAQKQLKTHET